MDFPKVSAPEWLKNEEHYLKLLHDNVFREKIPLMNVIEWFNISNSSLVRFHGMVQDMHSPEYYLEKVEVVNQNTNEKTFKSSRFGDVLVSEDECINFDSDSNVTAERQTYVVISVPGINNWVQNMDEGRFETKFNPEPFRTTLNKRTHEEEMDTEETHETSQHDASKKICIKIECDIESTNESVPTAKDFSSNFPLPNNSAKICHLKVYKNQEDLKLNKVYEFIGFLATDAIIEPAPGEDDNSMEFKTLHPPTSLVPRIHCVSFKQLEHQNPLLLHVSDPVDRSTLDTTRKDLLLLLTPLLLGDELAAEYLLLHLVSEIFIRTNLLPLGKFSLNISNIPKLEDLDYASELYKFIEKIVCKSYYLPMTLENLNDLSFVPKKDYESNSLASGVLQLSDNTHVVLDETKLSAGKLNAAGVNNVRAISSAVRHQRVAYDFNYYPIEYDCDIPFLTLSEGKSMLYSDVHIPLKPDATCVRTFKEILQAADHFLKPSLLDDIRRYLTLVRHTKYEIADNVQGLVQEEFVNMRQQGNVTADDLHELLVLARLLSISQGRISLDEECWKKACNLHQERRKRMA